MILPVLNGTSWIGLFVACTIGVSMGGRRAARRLQDRREIHPKIAGDTAALLGRSGPLGQPERTQAFLPTVAVSLQPMGTGECIVTVESDFVAGGGRFEKVIVSDFGVGV